MADKELIEKFYISFQQKDFKTMQSLYADDAVFNDSVFRNLTSAEVKAMWEMLISKATDMSVVFSGIEKTGELIKAHWDATYTFSSTGRRVVNKIDATFKISNGRITAHTDSFDFYAWAKQAFGFTGFLLGWTSFFKEKVRKQARQNLDAFIAKQH